MRLKDRIAIVTGGGSGIGREIALAFAEEGANIVLAGRTQDKINAVADEIKTLGRKALAIQTDVSVEDQVRRMVEKAMDEFGKIDILVNNAGGPLESWRTLIVDLDYSVWRSTIDVNISGTFLCTKAVLPHMLQRKSGVIINISSSMGHRGRAGMSAYSAAKFGVEGLTQATALEAYPFNIRVNTLQPGNLTATPQMIKAHGGEDSSKWLQPSVIRRAAVYLASDDSIGVTGQSIAATTWNMQNRDIKELLEQREQKTGGKD